MASTSAKYKNILFSIFIILKCIPVVTATVIHTDFQAKELAKCIGLYCGRMIDVHGNYSECGACNRGHVVDSDGVCMKCTGSPSFYDWMYLAFMPIVSLGFHWFFIDYTNRRKNNRFIILHVSALVETVAACICAILLVEPIGSFDVTSCPVRQISDWYTLFHNPKPDYVTEIHCTQEAVYPLYSLVFIFFAFCLVFLLLLRPLLCAKLVMRRSTASLYAALYLYPILVCLHTLLAGLFYYSFAYIVIVASVTTNAVHLANIRHQSFLLLLKAQFTDVRNIAILLLHWLAHTFGIIALTQLRDPAVDATFICLIPAPAIFYILTVKLTEPSTVDSV